MLDKLYKLNEQDLQNVAANLSYSRHAKKQIKERLGVDVENSTGKIDLEFMVMDSKLAYVNTDKAINIAFSKTTYLVVAQNTNGTYYVITFKEPSHNKITVEDKYNLALKGVKR